MRVELADLLAKAAPTSVGVKSVLARTVSPAIVTDCPAFKPLNVMLADSVEDAVPGVTTTTGDSGMIAPATPGFTAEAAGAVAKVNTSPLRVVAVALPENVPVYAPNEILGPVVAPVTMPVKAAATCEASKSFG